jgi:hypothetical protein
VTEATGAPTAVHQLDAEALPVAPDRFLANGDTIVIGELALDVIHLRGHTPGSVALALRPAVRWGLGCLVACWLQLLLPQFLSRCFLPGCRVGRLSRRPRLTLRKRALMRLPQRQVKNLETYFENQTRVAFGGNVAIAVGMLAWA